MDPGINNDISEYKDSLFFGLRNYLYEEHGIFINLDKKESVSSKLYERMAQLNIKAINEYLYLLDRDSGYKNERNKLFDILDFNEYYFNSNPDQLDGVINEIISEIFNNDLRQEDKKIRILVIEKDSLIQSYSVFFALDEAFHSKKPDWVFQIQACDPEKNGRDRTPDFSYDKKYLQNMRTDVIKKYFLKTNDIEYRIKDEYTDTVSFNNIDFLKSSNKDSSDLYDLIFCRNLMFLYEKQHKNLVAKNLYSLLKPGGFLFLGEEESLHGISPEFKLFLFPGSLAYKKE